MNSVRSYQQERTLRTKLRDNLEMWSRAALLPAGQEPARHHLMIMRALEDVSSGATRRLMLLLPPGAAKSTYASRCFPAWWMAKHPRSSVIMACHTARLAEHFGRGIRGQLESQAGRLGVRVEADARAAGRFVTNTGGEFFAIGVHGAVTGRRADLALIDDPIRSFAEAESFSAREHLWDWFRSELVTRLKPQGRMILVMTRWHADDLAGRLLEQGGWTTLRLPALAEEGDPLGRAPGDVLWPEWEDRCAIEGKRAILGERQFAALFQQAPMREGGQVFDARKLRVVDAIPEGSAVRAWDLAGTAGTGSDPDWTVGLKLVRDAGGAVFVDDVVRFRAVPGEVAERIRAVAAMDGPEVVVGLPQDPGQAGKSQVMFLTQLLGGFRVVATPESGAKIVRAMPVAAQVSAGTMAIRRAGWNAVFLDELSSFPEGRKDDQVDALARAFSMLVNVKPAARFAHLPFSTR